MPSSKLEVVSKGYEDGLAALWTDDSVLLSVTAKVRASTHPTCDILRKEVIQPQVPLRLPCYDFTPVTEPTVVGCLLQAGWRTTFG